MKKKIIVNGDLQDLVTYCTAIYEVDKDVNLELITRIFNDSPIFANKSFDIKIIGTLQKNSVSRESKLFIEEYLITLQIRYEVMKVSEIEFTKEDEDWIKKDVNRLLEHFELLLSPFKDEEI